MFIFHYTHAKTGEYKKQVIPSGRCNVARKFAEKHYNWDRKKCYWLEPVAVLGTRLNKTY